MMCTKRYSILSILLLLVLNLSAQNIRYVSKSGAYANNGLSWATAKINIQDAINDLVNSGLTGEVWVAEGTYTPTESTESTGGSTLYMSFKIPAGITVRGGFRGQVVDGGGNVTYAGEATAADRVMESQDGEGHAYQNLDKYYKYRTILSGNLSSPAEFSWNNAKKQYETTFYGNCYHVVWFAMNGFDSKGRAKALSKEAKLEGCVITNGHAYNTSLTERQHNAFGGGAYMVPNSTMENVFVLNCDASRDGGGIYMDGGGLVRKCYVADCQALGIGVENGFGGGIFMDGNGQQHGIVTQSGILNCVARMGGGLAIKNGTGSDGKTYLSAFATMVNNNTATTEGGGVYIMNGGALGNLTIVRNQCNGTGVISNGMATGRAGGLYCRDQAIIANSIIWGNEVSKNNNIQYASSRSSASNDKKPRMQYCGIAKSDYIDWSGTSKKGIISLAESNSGSHTSSEGLALFTTPTTTSGHIDGLATSNLTTYNWQLQSESSLHDAGIQLIDLDLNQETDAPAVGRDINNETYHPHCTLGAFVSPNYNIAPAESSEEFSFYVDPEFIFSVHTDDAKGMSWDRPTRFLGNVLELIRQDAATQADVDAGRATKVGAHQWTGKKINIYVKSGTVDNTNSFVSGRLRTISLNVPSNVNIYGSYDRSLKGTDLSKRNPVLTPTVISARLMDDYSLNVAHIITLDGVHDVTIDGFKISYANAYSKLLASTNQDGAALTIKNSTTNIHLRNLVVSNNQANHGAAVYADGSTADFENCIFHNNTSNNIKNSGLIYGINSSSLTFEHCNVLRSVGHASYVDATSHNVWKNSMFYGNLREAQDNTNNCAELSIEAFDGTVANISGTHNMADMKSKTAYPTVFGDIPGATAYNANALNYTYQSGVANGYPRMVNPTKNAGVSPNGDVTYYGRATSFEPHNDNPVVNMASFSGAHSGTSTDNSWGYDITTIVTRDYGGLPDIGAVESHQSTSHQSILGDENENANADGQRPYGAITYVRDYSHNGDVAMSDASWTGTKKKTYDYDGANYTENLQGQGTYVKEGDQYVLLNGMSWKYAINGNATYTESSTTEHKAATAYTVTVTDAHDGSNQVGYYITSDGKYLYLDGTTPKVTTDKAQANVWLINGNKSGVSMTQTHTGALVSTTVNGTTYYLFRSGNNNNRRADGVTTKPSNFTLTYANASGQYKLNANGYYYVAGTTNVTLTAYQISGTTWSIQPAMEQIPASVTETEIDDPVQKGTDIAANAVVSPEDGTVAHKLHVYADVDNLKKTNDPYAYRLGMYNGGANTYYAYNNTGSVLNSTTTRATGDKFAFIRTNEENKYYIYNVTQGKFVTYTTTSQSGANANIIRLEETANTSNGTWWVVPSTRTADCVNIIPGTLTVGSSTVNWNYYGGSGNQLGLYNRTDANSQWRIEATKAYTSKYKIVQSHASTTKNGLQYAVDMAHDRLGLGTRTENKTELGTPVTLTYHDLPVGMENGVVWVGAGIYTRAQGYEIRNHVKVFGAFPKEGDPAEDQRHPQLSEGIALSKENKEKHLNYKDFETILETHTAKGQKTNVTSVLTHPVECRVTTGDDSNTPASRVVYEGAEWDGFTIRYGYKHGVTGGGGGRRNSGAGVSMYENVVLRNCVVRDNYLDTGNGRSAGIYCDGSSIENCYILDNVSNCPNENFGGGVYMIQGTMFNSVIAGNSVGTAAPRGAGIFLESAKFYNNTIVNNTGGSAIGIYTASKATADLTVYNSIVIAGPGQVVLQRQSTDTPTDFVNCLLKSDQANGSGTNGLTGTDNVTLNSACHTYLNQDLANNNPFVLPYSEAVSNYDYRINFKTTGGVVDNFNCVNAGTEDLGAKITLPDNDMDWTERIQDCRVDIGAYEYNGSYDISPDITSVSGQAIYYVTPDGKGTSSAKDPENAACASKLQKVIDAAGRYKYQHPTTQVIVKVANSKAFEEAGTPFEYYATRTTNLTSTDTRLWSIIIPRGVEVWGGYTDANSDSSPWTNSKNGFQTRDVVGNPTYFASSFYNREAKINAITYHVVTFTDYVYDADGHPYMKGDEAALAAGQNGTYLQKVNTSGSLSDDAVLLMSDRVNTSASAEAATIAGNTEYISTRAVLDGIFVSGGKADGKDFVGETTAKNVNGYGGAAIVTDYAHVRNCILKGNNATYGGALALKERALVSGCLMLENSADQRGGALYVFENGDELSDGSTINTAQGGGATMDTNMSHVFTSTIVNNHAEQGGGVWFSDDEFTPNVRFSSVVIWQNQATDQANVSGNAMPNKPLGDHTSPEEYYPFAYSAIQNIRAAGTNNISVDGQNMKGVRFSDKSIDLQDPSLKRTTIAEEVGDEPKLRNFSYYGLTNYSTLVHTGMPKTQYETLKQRMAVAAADFTGVDRTIETKVGARTYLEIGARAIKKVLPEDRLMLRLFVTEPGQVDMVAAQKMMDLASKTSPSEEDIYYSQEGSSFAYPFQSLQDALDYVYDQRASTRLESQYTYANNLPFEICMTGGTYYPTRDLSAHYGQSLANTFAIPEGVGIYGGFAIDELGANTFYGAGYKPKNQSTLSGFTAGSEGNAHWISDNVDALSNTTQSLQDKATDPTWTLSVKQLSIDDMLAAREKLDVNSNNIIEPWEFFNQTILSGNTTNAENAGVYHVVTAVADQNIVGMLPKASIVHGHYDAHEGATPTCTGYDDHEEGQTIHLNGVTITGGYAHHYTDGSLDQYGQYVYYLGGGMMVDGNRYNDNYNKVDDHTYGDDPGSHPACVTGLGAHFNEQHRAAYAVGYRDIPVSITNCKFVNNSAGYGGAITSNGTVDIFASSFEQNLAIQDDEHMTIDVEGTPTEFSVQYPGQGGAIHATHQLSVFNTMFVNNEAQSGTYKIDAHTHKSFRVQNPDVTGGIATMDGAGGAIMMGTEGTFHIVNCDFVKNKANMYPAIFTLNPDKHPLQDPDAAAKGRENAYKMAYAKTFGTRKALGDNDAAADAAATTAAETAYAALSNDDDAIQHYYENIQTPDYSQVINSVFWGNEVHPEMLRQYAGNETFMTASKLVVNVGLKGRIGAYNPSFDKDYAPTPSYDQYDLLNSSINDCRFQEMVWFSAYEDGCGFKPMNDYDCRDLDYKPFGHAFYQVQKYLKDTYPTRKTGYNYQNCNILLDSDNGSLEGPNFVNPSHNAGIDGYLEAADWSPARLNNLTDNGSGRIMQTIATSGENYLCTFDKYAQDSDVPGDRALYSSEKAGSYITKGAYTMTHYINTFPEYQQNLSLGDDYYMESAYDLPTYDAGGNVVPDVYTHQKLLRISYDPNPTHNQTYIDMGVYEYPHTELKFHTEDECDILWVSSAEKPDNGLPEGSAWTQPTSDLQRAIETLLASRNGHRKEIRLMDGTFTPIYTIDGHLSFYIDTYYQNSSVTLPDYDENDVPDYDLGVTSFTIKGGYSRDLNNQYDVNLYPAVIKGQNRTDESSDRWDHLFYIKDATQRYGKQEYNESNAYGAKINSSTLITTIPIEIDGVTLINDQAKADVNGAAIYFEDQARTIDGHAYQSSGASTSHISVFKYYTDEKKTTPSPDNAPTLYYDREEVTTGTYPYADNTGTAKFIMSKSTVYGSGSYNNLTSDEGDKNTTSAVYIGRYGGHALLFNNVFHSNYGNPLVAYNAVTVNNTFAQNRGGFVDLKNDASTSTVPSSIKNSVLWCNNWSKSSSAYLKQFNLAGYTGDDASATIFDHNAYTGASFNGTDYAALDSHGDPSDIAKVYYNVNLANENSDVIYGPNFIDPENSDLSKRNYMIMPSLRLLNKGDNNLYKDNVTVAGQDYLTPVANPSHAFNTSANIYDQAWITTTQHDAASSARFVNRDIDLGAYEYQQDLDRVIYVDPNKTVNGSGKDWSSPLGYGMIQDAIDLAAVYVVNHQNDGSGKEAYVFVKGASGTNKGLHTGETITPRNGVQVYGSIGADYSDIAKRSLKTDPIEKATEDDAFFDEFVNDMLAQREGVASNAASKTTISGIHTNGTGFGTEQVTLVDGFDVTATTASNADGVITEPVISIKPLLDGSPSVNPANTLKLALRNIIVHDNDASASPVNVAEVDNALIYEVLMRDNKVDDAHSVLKLGTYGWLVNGTVEGKTTGANGSYALNGGADAAAEAASHVYYSLVNYGADEPTWKTLSGYNYPVEDKNLNYQLAENSKHIDAVEPIIPLALPATLNGFINYSGDRDILGNPRYLTRLKPENQSRLDRGAFETWKVEDNFICGTNGTVHGASVTTLLAPQFYPHDGSVVYIMAGKSLVIDPLDQFDVKPTAHNPGYMLLQEGASCYGNGRPITCAYLAVERKVKKTAGAVVSLPYTMDYKKSVMNTANETQYVGVAVPQTDANGILTLHADAPTVYTYDGNERSDWQYTFAKESSDCWKTVSAGNAVEANNGVLYVPNDGTVVDYGSDSDADGTNDLVTLRFTGKGADMSDYIYTESGVSKTVTLTQYNDGGRDTHENGNTDDNADFTDNNDMGWNAIGLPYLVSQYQPYNTVTVDAEHNSVTIDASVDSEHPYQMHIPHTFWMWYDGKKYADGTAMTPGAAGVGDGGFYTVNSWDNTNALWHVGTEAETSIWVGEGFFTQTATLEPSETLTFYRPVAPTKAQLSGGSVKTERWYMTDEIRNIEENTGKRIIATRYYTPDGILQAKPVKGVTIQVDFYDDGSQKSHKYLKR